MTSRGNRDELVIATKYTGLSPASSSAKIRANYAGNHIKSLLLSLEASLKNMETTYVDIVSPRLCASDVVEAADEVAIYPFLGFLSLRSRGHAGP